MGGSKGGRGPERFFLGGWNRNDGMEIMSLSQNEKVMLQFESTHPSFGRGVALTHTRQKMQIRK